MAGGTPNRERLEGRSLLPFLHGKMPEEWRSYVICEQDYSPLTVREHMQLTIADARATMLRSKRWKFILHEVFRPQLFDMENDPQEQNDLGEDPQYAELMAGLEREMFRWFRRRKLRFTRTNDYVMFRSQVGWTEDQGVFIGHWDDPRAT